MIGVVVGVVLAAGVAGCTGESGGDAADSPAAGSAAEELSADAPRAFFVGLASGDTVPLLAELEFGVENFGIEPVGDGFVHEGMGHFHLGVDTDCLDPGVIIPTAAPWIHFGDGNNLIEIDLEPGRHRLVVQIGDGEHRTLDEPGLCQVIEVTAVEQDPNAG